MGQEKIIHTLVQRYSQAMMNTKETTLERAIPLIEYNLIKGQFYISGTSIPEDPSLVFEPFLNEARKYSQKPAEKTTVIINLDYANTASLKWIFYVLQVFEDLYINKHDVEIVFYYEDENTFQTGRFLSMNLAIPIQLEKGSCK